MSQNQLQVDDAHPSHRRTLWLTLWLALVTLGFVYVSAVLCRRMNPFQSDNNAGLDLFVLLGAALTLYQIGPALNWPPENAAGWSVFRWNVLGYCVPFFAALHWELASQAVGAGFSLKAADLRQLESADVWMLTLLIPALFALLAYHVWLAFRSKARGFYLSWLIGVPASVTAMVWCWSGNGYLHIHHYCLAAYLIPLLRFRVPISLIAQGFSVGLFVEGIARWGIDPLWYFP